MSELLSAKKARELTETNKEIGLSLVLQKIEEACNKGLTSIIVDSISDSTVEELKKLEYQVDQRTFSSNLGIRISW